MINKNKIVIKEAENAKSYYAVELYSDISEQKIFNYGFLINCYSRSHNIEGISFVCSEEELKKIKNYDKSIPSKYQIQIYDYFDIITVFVVSTIPRNSYIYINSVPNLKDSKANETVFTIANKQVDNEIVIDKTTYSGRLSSNTTDDFVSLEYRDRKLLERDHELKSSLSELEAELFLASIKNSVPVIEFSDKKLLGVDKKDETD